ncbi:hypothetical protein JCM24511_01145 [Saitozyma sp. JCM 24511]|nr:hypothetical protein JCM24511_01145 [Saitozyma sp. JCM 24511]
MLLSASPPRGPLFGAPSFLWIPSAGLLLAYLYALAHRPDVPEHLKVEDRTWDRSRASTSYLSLPYLSSNGKKRLTRRVAGRWGYPAWYGRSDGRGELPWETQEGEDKCTDPTSVLLFIDLELTHASSDLPPDSLHMPHALSTLDSLSSSPRTTLKAISPFSPGWNASRGVGWNLAQQGCMSVDVIWRIGEGPSTEAGCGNVTWISPVTFYPSRSVSRRSVTYFPNPSTPASEYPKLPWGKQWSLDRLPPPIRSTMIDEAASRSRPPRMGDGAEPLAPDSKFRRYWDKEEKSARRRCFEGWEHGVLDERMVQAMHSGCVVATVIPDVQRGRPELPVSQLERALDEYGTPTLQAMALEGFVIARQKFLPSNRLRDVLEAYTRWSEGARGYLRGKSELISRDQVATWFPVDVQHSRT